MSYMSTTSTTNTFRKSTFWQQLLIKQQFIVKEPIYKLFLKDHNRYNNLSKNIESLQLLVDFSKQYIDLEILNILFNAAKHCELEDRIKDLFKNTKLNITENKRVTHTALRENMYVGPEIEQFIDQIYNTNIENIIYLGIGGSYLGPMMSCYALDAYTDKLANKINFYFIANHEQTTIEQLLIKLNKQSTILIISSKSFTTEETILNAKIIIPWLYDYNKIFAITAQPDRAIAFGINSNNIFKFENTVGGRYSVWSTVGLPIAIKIGVNNFKKFLSGASIIDEHFKNADLTNNIPIIMALIGIWNINFMGYKSLAIMPYLNELEYFPDYLQQLEMESNGKTIDLQNNPIDYDTAPIVWGGVGCNGQHSYMQLLHQGSQIVPVDFIVSANKKSKFLFANCLAQSQALMQGNTLDVDLESFKYCRGNKPSSITLFPELTPEILGALLALYEHKVFVQGIMWNINSFDQWGVELGKILAKQIITKLDHQDNNQLINKSVDSSLYSTINLINQYNKLAT